MRNFINWKSRYYDLDASRDTYFSGHDSDQSSNNTVKGANKKNRTIKKQDLDENMTEGCQTHPLSNDKGQIANKSRDNQPTDAIIPLIGDKKNINHLHSWVTIPTQTLKTKSENNSKFMGIDKIDIILGATIIVINFSNITDRDSIVNSIKGNLGVRFYTFNLKILSTVISYVLEKRL